MIYYIFATILFVILLGRKAPVDNTDLWLNYFVAYLIGVLVMAGTVT